MSDSYTAAIIQADGNDTHFADLVMQTYEQHFAPPAKPMPGTKPLKAESMRFLILPEGWFGDWHPAPGITVGIVVRGEIEEATTVGETRRFGPGDVVIGNDKGSKGHTTKALSETVLAIITLNELPKES